MAGHVDAALFAAMQESLRRLYHNTFVNPTKLANELRMSLLLQVISAFPVCLSGIDDAVFFHTRVARAFAWP